MVWLMVEKESKGLLKDLAAIDGNTIEEEKNLNMQADMDD